MGLFGQMGDMYKLQKEAKKMKKELASLHVFSEANGVKITVNGEQQIVGVEIIDNSILQDPRKLEKTIENVANKAMKKAQQIAAEKMKSLMGGFGGMDGLLNK